MSYPLVSILTPSLNQEPYVRDSLNSVANQNYPRIEQVIVDADSSDGTKEAIAEFTGERHRLLVSAGCTQSEALNLAFADSRGEIIGWVNTDDALFSTDSVSSVVALFKSNPTVSVVYGDAVTVDESGRILRYLESDHRRLNRITKTSPIVQPAVFVRRSAIGDTFVREDLQLKMDYELWLRLSRNSEFLKVRRVLAIDRNYPSRKSRARIADRQNELARLAIEYGLPFDSRRRLSRLSRSALSRVTHVPHLLKIEDDYDQIAFAAVFDSRLRRIVRQMLIPQSFIGRF